MSKLVTIAENSLMPYKVLEGAGIKTKSNKHGIYFLKDPTDGKPNCIIQGKSIVSDNPFSKFKSGSVIDYLAYTSGSYNKALDMVANYLTEPLEEVTQSKWELIKPKLMEECKNKRRLFQFLLDLRDTSKKSQKWYIQNTSKAKKLGVNLTMCPNSVFLTQGGSNEKFIGFLSKYSELSYSSLDNSPYLIFPYFNDFHTIGSIYLLNLNNGETLKLGVDPARLMYFGILEVGSFVKETYMCKNFLYASAHSSYLRDMYPESFCLGVVANPEADTTFVKFENSIFLQDPREPLSLPSIIDEEYEGVRIAHRAEGVYVKNSRMFTEYLSNKLWILLQQSAGKITRKVEELLGQVSPSKRQINFIYEYLMSKNLTEAAGKIKDTTKKNPVYMVCNDTYMETPDGYTIKDKSTGVNRLISNFIFQFYSNVSFSDTGDVYHYGKMSFEGVKYPIMLQSSKLDNTKEIEKAARLAEMQKANITSSSNIPFIFDHKSAKNLPLIFTNTIKNLPRSEGVMAIGWSEQNDAFLNPRWTVDADGQVTTPLKVPYPSNIHFRKFSFHPSLLRSSHRFINELSSSVQDAVYIILALLCRSYMSYPVGPVFYKNTGQTKVILEALFKGLGQTTAIATNNQIRSPKYFEGLERHPFLVVGMEEKSSKSIKLPIVALTSEGFSLTPLRNMQVLDELPDMMERMVISTVEWLLETEGAEYETITSPSYDVDLIAEGCSVVEKACSSKSSAYQKKVSGTTKE